MGRFRGRIGRKKKPREIRDLPTDFSLHKHFFLDSGRVLGYICQSRQVGAPEVSAPLSIAGHTALSVPSPSCPDLFRASTSCGIAVRAGSGRGGGGTWMPGTSPGMTEERKKRRGSRARHVEDTIVHAAIVVTNAAVTRRARVRHFRTGLCRRKCRPACRVGKCRHSRSASAGTRMSTRSAICLPDAYLDGGKRMESTSCTLSTTSSRTTAAVPTETDSL